MAKSRGRRQVISSSGSLIRVFLHRLMSIGKNWVCIPFITKSLQYDWSGIGVGLSTTTFIEHFQEYTTVSSTVLILFSDPTVLCFPGG